MMIPKPLYDNYIRQYKGNICNSTETKTETKKELKAKVEEKEALVVVPKGELEKIHQVKKLFKISTITATNANLNLAKGD